jgi:hypothetical protein
MRAFTTFNVKLYPIQHAEGADEAVEKSPMNHISKKMEVGNFLVWVVMFAFCVCGEVHFVSL